jgi:hypothetical protein
MIELHDYRGEPPATVKARHVAEPCEQLDLTEPDFRLGDQSWRHTALWPTPAKGFALPLGPDAVAVCAYHVALGDLFQKHFLGFQLHFPREGKRLGVRISMVEVHNVRRKRSTTIGTRHCSKSVEQIRRRTLAVHDPSDLCLSVRHVVPSVVSALLRTHRKPW